MSSISGISKKRVFAAPQINQGNAANWVLTMSIRMLARELYRVMKEGEHLEGELKNLVPGAPQRDELERRLIKARAEERRIKTLLDGAKAD